MEIKTDPKVKMVFANYPDKVREKMLELRDLVLEAANEIDDIKSLQETLKWGEPSYITKYGSTLRMHWKESTPNQYAMYFKCTSRLVETIRTVFKNKFNYQGNRAIVFGMGDSIQKKELKECIKAALTYHKIKQLKTLGILDEKTK